jgi:O-antigen ligase
MERAGRYLGPAVLWVALGLAPALGYATTHFVLALGAVALIALAAAPSTAFGGPPPPSSTGEDQRGARSRLDPPPRGGGGGPSEGWWRGRPSAPTLLFALAFLLIALSALVTLRGPADLLPLFGFAALLFHAPLARHVGGADLARIALIGAGVGLAVALFYRFGLGTTRAADGFWLIDPYRLAVTTLLAAFLGLGGLFPSAPLPPAGRGSIGDLRTTPSLNPSPQGGGRRWLSLLGLVAALGVIVLTGSRTALLALPVLLLVTGLCLVRRPATIVAVLVATAAIVIAVLFVELPGTARTRLWDVFATIAGGGQVADAAIDIRLGLYSAGAELFALAPLFGHGWSEAMMPFVLERLRPDQLNWGRIVHLHNDVVQFAVSGGLLGLAAWALMLAAPIVGWLRLPRDERTPRRRHALLVLVTGAVLLGVPDTYLAAPMTLTAYVVLVAAVVGRAPRGPT